MFNGRMQSTHAGPHPSQRSSTCLETIHLSQKLVPEAAWMLEGLIKRANDGGFCYGAWYSGYMGILCGLTKSTENPSAGSVQEVHGNPTRIKDSGMVVRVLSQNHFILLMI